MFLNILKRLLLTFVVFNSCAFSASGNLFNIISTGDSLAQVVSLTLCLNVSGQNPLSCQDYRVEKTDIAITTTAPDHIYSKAGIKINTPGYQVTFASSLITQMNNSLVSGYVPLVLSHDKAVHGIVSATSSHTPGAPTEVIATAGNRVSTVSWQAPNDGGYPINRYTATASGTGGAKL